MQTIEKIKADWLAARKSRDAIRSSLLGTLVGAITTKEKTFNPARQMTDAEVIGEVKKMLDGVVETGQLLLANPTRIEQIATNEIERTVLISYMPPQLSEQELTDIATTRKEAGDNMGGIMAYLKANHGGAYDGKMASMVAKKVLV